MSWLSRLYERVVAFIKQKPSSLSWFNRLIVSGLLLLAGFCMASVNLSPERRPLTYTPVYKTPPQRRKKDRATDENTSPEKRPIVQHGLDLPSDPMLTDCLPTPTLNYPQNHVPQQSTYNHPPTMADFKQMAMDAYNQRNHQNVSDYIYCNFLIVSPVEEWFLCRRKN